MYLFLSTRERFARVMRALFLPDQAQGRLRVQRERRELALQIAVISSAADHGRVVRAQRYGRHVDGKPRPFAALARFSYNIKFTPSKGWTLFFILYFSIRNY